LSVTNRRAKQQNQYSRVWFHFFSLRNGEVDSTQLTVHS
jgi:hypothetical protein